MTIEYQVARDLPTDVALLAVPVCSDHEPDHNPALDWTYLGQRGFEGNLGQAQSLPGELGIQILAVGMGSSDPSSSIGMLAFFTFLVAFGSASQDVVTDGWRIDAAPLEKQGIMAAAYQLGYRLAMLCAGAGALYIAEFMSWRVAYFSMAGLLLVGFVAALISPIVDREPDGGRPVKFDVVQAVKAPRGEA